MGVLISLGACQPAAFGGVIGHPRYTQWANGQSGDAPGPTPTPTPATPTATYTPVPTATPTAAVADFVFYAPSSGTTEPVIYAQGSAGYPAGDTVTILANAGNWAANQYTTQAQGLSGTPGPLPSGTIHDSSFEGCLLPGTTSVTINSYAPFNHGGVGNCDTPPTVGQTYAIPIINQAYKNENPPCTSNGGYCVYVIGIALVQITNVDWPHVVQGVVVGVDGAGSDPYGVIAPPATPTATPTPTPTNTPLPTDTPVGPL